MPLELVSCIHAFVLCTKWLLRPICSKLQCVQIPFYRSQQLICAVVDILCVVGLVSSSLKNLQTAETTLMV